MDEVEALDEGPILEHVEHVSFDEVVADVVTLEPLIDACDVEFSGTKPAHVTGSRPASSAAQVESSDYHLPCYHVQNRSG